MNKSKKEKQSILYMDIKDIFDSNFLNKELSPKGIAAIIISIVLVCFYGYFIVYPKFSEYKTIKSNLNEAKLELSTYQEKLEKIPSLNDKLNSLNREANVKNQRLSHDMEDGLFLIGLDKFMKNLGINLVSYTIEDSVNYDTFYAIPMNLNIDGNYRSVKELIYYLEQQKNITQVMDYNITTKPTEIKKEIQKKVYWTKEDKLYHLNKECEKMLQGEVLWGNSDQSGSRQPDLNCVGDMSNTVDVQVFTEATGDVSANIRFIVYSSEKDIIKLETDKPSQWKPGKNNPFEDTLS